MRSEEFLETSLQFVKGVGPHLAERLFKKNLHKIEDLLHFYPRAYHHVQAVQNVQELHEGQHAILKGEIFRKNIIQRSKRSSLYVVMLRTHDQDFVTLKYFKLPYKGFFDSIEIGQNVQVYGEVFSYNGKMEFHHPEFLPIDYKMETGVIPVYSEIEGVSNQKHSKILHTIFQMIESNDHNVNFLPEWMLEKFNLMNTFESLKDIHNPSQAEPDLYLKHQAPCQKTLIFEELFKLQLHLCLKKKRIKNRSSYPIHSEGRLSKQLIQSLPFSLTHAQQRVFQEITDQIKHPHPMYRLIQGDVGCGKTLIAFLSSCQVIESGYQCAFMVPTEILAEQHFKQARLRLKDLSIQLLTSKVKNKKTILKSIETGECQLCIGTHALLQESVKFKNLGLVIIDEQHRFGVYQRHSLAEKGNTPHCLVMTATPIPRTLSMTLYGDLDISIVNEMPPGRQPIVTKKTRKRKEVFEFLEKEVSKGRQAYVVYPLIEESEKMDLKNATEQFEKLKNSFPHIRWALLHGQMKTEEKSQVMKDFISNKIQVLVTTTVIEVGVDVPNATLMIVEHSERFGLSQLHQLRGRIGRGSEKSYCVLILGDRVSKESYMRAVVMEKYLDGFQIAEEDLKLRGAGEIFGTKQSGDLNFKIANFIRDVEILQQARKVATDLLESDPLLEKNPILKKEMEKVSKIRLI